MNVIEGILQEHNIDCGWQGNRLIAIEHYSTGPCEVRDATDWSIRETYLWLGY